MGDIGQEPTSMNVASEHEQGSKTKSFLKNSSHIDMIFKNICSHLG
jgi:hypothetical protein